LGVHIIVAKDAMEIVHPIKRISSPVSAKKIHLNSINGNALQSSKKKPAGCHRNNTGFQ